MPEVTIYLPEADKLLTEYGEKYLKIRFTTEILRFNGVKAGIPQSSSESETSGIKYNVDIMKALNKESAGEVEGSYEKQIQKVVAFYQGHQAIVYDFMTSLNALKLEYIKKLQKIEYKYESKNENISIINALSFMTDVNLYVNKKLTEFILLFQRMSASEDNIKY